MLSREIVRANALDRRRARARIVVELVPTDRTRDRRLDMSGGKADVANTPSSREKLTWIVLYSLCSSTMLVINKLAVSTNGLPTVVSGAQLAVSAAVVTCMEVGGMRVLGPFERKRIHPSSRTPPCSRWGCFQT